MFACHVAYPGGVSPADGGAGAQPAYAGGIVARILAIGAAVAMRGQAIAFTGICRTWRVISASHPGCARSIAPGPTVRPNASGYAINANRRACQRTSNGNGLLYLA